MKKITLIFTMLLFATMMSWQSNAQFSEDFSAGVPGAFTQTYVTGAIDWADCGGALGGQTCTESATLYEAGYTNNQTSLETPSMDLSAGGFDLTFDHSQKEWAGDQNTLLVELSTDNGGTWTTIMDYTTDIPSVVPESFNLDAISTLTATCIVRFTGTVNYGYSIILDNVVVAPTPACPNVTNLNASNFSAPSNADLSWDAATGATGYNWEIQPQGTAQGDAALVEGGNVATNMASATSLVDGTDYTLYVQTYCGGGALGNWISYDFSYIIPPANDTFAGATPITPSAEGTGCTTFTFQNHLAGDGTSDSGMEGSCYTGFEGLDRFYSWTATSDGLLWNDGDGNPGIIIWDTMGNEIACEPTYAADDTILNGWNVGDDLIIQVYDYINADVDVSFCLEEYNFPACPDVLNLSASNFVAPGSADLSWDVATGATGYNWEIQPQGTAQGDAALVEGGNVATNMASATSLVDGTDYTLYVQSDCGGGITGNYTSLDFTFNLPPVNNDCSGVIDLGTLVSPYSASTVGANNSFNQDCLTNIGAPDVVYSILVPDTYTIDIGQDSNTYDSKNRVAYGASCPGDMLIECNDDPDTNRTIWENTTGSDQTVYWIQSAYSTASGDYVLSWTVTAPPACPDVTNLNASNFSASNADLSWDVATGATGYNWEIQPQGTAQGDAALVEGGNVATNMASATSLVDGTAYTLYVQSDCGGGTMGNYVSYDFTFNLPPANDDACNAESITLNAAPIVGNNSASSQEINEPNGSCWFGTTGSFNSVWYSFVATSTDAVVSTDFDTALDDTHIAVYTMTDCADMTTLTEVGCDEDGGSTGNGWNSIADLTGLLTPGTTYYVQVEGYTSSVGEFNIEVTAPTCGDPSIQTAVNITDVSVDLGWTVGADAETMWDVEWGAPGFVVETGAEIGSANDTMDNPLSVAGLTASTDYEFYVRAVCSATLNSAWVGPFPFTTLAPQPPANDNVCDAIEIIVDADSAGDAFTDELATAETNEVIGSCFNGGIDGSVWFTFVAPAGGEVQVTTDIIGGTHTDTEIAVYEAPTDCADASTLGAELGCDQDGGDIVGFGYMSYLELTGLTVGNTYYIQVDRWGSAATGTFGLEVNTPPACPDVANLSASNFLAAGTADFAWDASVGAAGYNWEVQPQGVAQGTAGAIDMGNVATNAAMGTNMMDGTAYTLYVQSDCGGGALGNFIAYDFTFRLTPSNDLCASPIALTVGAARDQNVVAGNNTSTTDSGEVAAICANYAGGDMWYSAVVPANGNMIVETMPVNGGGGDGGLAVYSGTCGALTEIECNDDDGDGLFGLIDLTGLTPGDTLLIRVWEFGNDAILDFNVVAYSLACPDITNINASNFLAAGTADLTWDEIVGVAGYNWEIQPQGVAQGTAGAIDMGNVATNAASATNLVDGTTYTLYVQSDCGGGALGNWISQDFTFNLPPANDTFAGATPITPSAEGTGCTNFTFQNHLAGDGTTDSGMEGSCYTGNEGLDRFYSWTATSNALVWNDGDGNPGIIIWDTMGNEIACEPTFAADDTILNGWNVGDDLIIQVYDFVGADVDVSFCLEELNIMVALPDCPTLLSPLDGAVDVLSPVILDWDAATTGDPADSYNVYVSINGGAEYLFANYTDTETPAIGLQPDLTVVWRVVPVNAAGENTACATAFTFSSVVGTDDYDGDGVDNITEYNNSTDMTLPCDPVQAAGYTGYDSSNAIWLAEDCDGDGQTNQVEFDGGSDPYDNTSVVSVDDLQSVGFTYYPNPVKDELTMTANENINMVTIYSMLGQEVLRVAPSSMETTVNVARLANGTYFVKAEVGDAVGTFKIVKN